MKKLFVLLSFVVVTSSALARMSGGEPFRPYRVIIRNHSGGQAKVEANRNIDDLRNNQIIENGADLTVNVKKNEASATFLAGAEGKTKREINVKFCAPDPGNAAKILTLTAVGEKGFTPSGFQTKCEPFDIEIENQSGGLAKLSNLEDGLSVKDKSLKNKEVVKGRAMPGSRMLVSAGPEGNKRNTQVIFGVKTGSKPKVTLNDTSGFIASAFKSRASGQDVHIRSLGLQTERTFKKATNAQATQKKAAKQYLNKKAKKQATPAKKPVKKTRVCTSCVRKSKSSR